MSFAYKNVNIEAHDYSKQKFFNCSYFSVKESECDDSEHVKVFLDLSLWNLGVPSSTNL